MFKKITFIVLLLLALSFSARQIMAQEFYADVSLDVKSDGTVVVSGITNDPLFSAGVHQDFTSKKGTYWLLNITSDKPYSDYIIDIALPQGTEFNYLKTSGRSRVSYNDGMHIIASGTDSLNILLQYQINEKPKSSWIWIIPLAAFIALVIYVLNKMYFKKGFSQVKKGKDSHSLKSPGDARKKSIAKSQSEASGEFEKFVLIKKTLSQSQEKIIDLLIDAGGELVQKQLQHRSGLAKATLSRNVDVLAKKGIIIKQSRGMTNMIMLNPDFASK